MAQTRRQTKKTSSKRTRVSGGQHQAYKVIIQLVKSRKLREPFSPLDIAHATRQRYNRETLRRFPSKHKKGNVGNDSELFVYLKSGKYRLIRPFKYGLK